VIVLDYPRLFNGTDCNALTFFSADEITRLNQTADMLKTQASAAATRAGRTSSSATSSPRSSATPTRTTRW
jgi:hypothetical protein